MTESFQVSKNVSGHHLSVKFAFPQRLAEILGFAVVAVGLTCTAFATDFETLAAKGYRWVRINGPYACTTQEDVQRITSHHTDAIELQMVQDLRAYYVIPGTIVLVVKNDPATGMSQIKLGGIARPLWTYARFLSARPIEDTYGVIQTPEKSGLIRSGGADVIDLPRDDGIKPLQQTTDE